METLSCLQRVPWIYAPLRSAVWIFSVSVLESLSWAAGPTAMVPTAVERKEQDVVIETNLHKPTCMACPLAVFPVPPYHAFKDFSPLL